jgi:prophage regulatory protein
MVDRSNGKLRDELLTDFAVPAPLQRIAGLRSVDPCDFQPAVYFLVRRGKVVHASLSRHPMLSISEHLRGNTEPIDSIFLVQCTDEDMSSDSSPFLRFVQAECKCRVDRVELNGDRSPRSAERQTCGDAGYSEESSVTPSSEGSKSRRATPPAPPQRRFIRLRELLTITGMSRSSIYQLVHLGKFPSSVKLSERAVAWDSADVERWLEERVNGTRR